MHMPPLFVNTIIIGDVKGNVDCRVMLLFADFLILLTTISRKLPYSKLKTGWRNGQVSAV